MFIRFNSQGVKYCVRKDAITKINSAGNNFPEIHLVDGSKIIFQGTFEDVEKLINKVN